MIDYNSSYYHYATHLTLRECLTHLDTETVSWVNVGRLGDQATLEKLDEIFRLHPLILADTVNVPQRPKLENHQADYLTYALWDNIIDSYFPVLEMYGEKIEELEELVLTQPSKVTLGRIYQVKRDLPSLRLAISPQKDMLRVLIRDGHDLIKERTFPYLKDCHEHTIQIIETLEIYRELASGLMDLYLSVVSNKMNEVMKLLAVISTIFIPLTFIAGLYDINFNPNASALNMPELNWAWGYPVCLAVMIMIALALSVYFWRKGWLN